MRHRGGSEQPVKKRRANGPKGRKVSTAGPSVADLQENYEDFKNEFEMFFPDLVSHVKLWLKNN